MKTIKYLEEISIFHRHLEADNTTELLTSYAKMEHLFRKTGDVAYKTTYEYFPIERCPKNPIEVLSPDDFEKELLGAESLRVKVNVAERVFDLLSAEMARCSILGLETPRSLIKRYCRVFLRNERDFYALKTIIKVCSNELSKFYPSGIYME
ncbi:MAG: hypothetical protein CL512_04890 [Actinobacteria bacterium]|nr:hypothetical protein [Actinomycetota bacterium]|tara:strand:- start:52 stop:507 length:456 start_codon:yes stop_codon:yes gene_type:complete